MEDEDGMENFEINDTDLEYAMNPGRRQFQSRDQATYGIWSARDNDSDDDEGESRPTFGKKRAKNYSAPVNFVSGGVKVGNKMEGENEEGQGGSQSKEEPIEINFARKQPRQQKKQAGGQVFAGMRQSAVRSTVDPNVFADWAKHGKGDVIMKMMKSMGYKEGSGLGKEAQGIVEPVQAAVRPGRAAVGAYGKESTGPKWGESAADAQKRIAEERGEGGGASGVKGTTPAPLPKGTWKKTAKVKTVYRTIDDVIKEGGAPMRAVRGGGGVKVIDMTGPEQRIYSGYDAFSMKTKAEYEDEERETFDVPELTHNINLLLDLTEEDIRRNDHQLGTLKDQTVALEYDVSRAKEELNRAENEHGRMKNVYDVLESFTDHKTHTMNECQDLFRRMKRDFREEYHLFHLEAVAIPLVLPLIVSHFSRWRPLHADDLIYGVDLMKEWKEVLDDGGEGRMFGQTNAVAFDKLCAFDRLLWDGWMPSVRRAALEWNPRDQAEQMIRVIEMWLPVLPSWMRENLLEQVIIPRIFHRVEEWDPLSDTVPIHSWLVPWLHTLGDRLMPVFAPIRQKLAKALRLWNPLDKSAILMLRPWIGVWTQATMSAFLSQNIVPKLEKCLEKMCLDPSVNSGYPEFTSVLDWLEMISMDTISNVICKYFFPRWYDTLCIWLDSAPSQAVHNEVKMWYREWQGRIPQQMQEFPIVKENLRRALVAMGQSMQGMRVSSAVPPPPLMAEAPPPPPPSDSWRQGGGERGGLPQPSHQQLTLKDVLELKAATHGLTYVPQPGRMKDGKQVFWFGTLAIYLDRGVVYAMDVDKFEWFPITLERLLLKNGVGV